VALLAGATYVFTSLSIGGRTLLDRVRGGPAPIEVAEAGADRTKSGVDLQKGAAPDAGAVKEPTAPAADRLTEEDRAGLDKLIETKLGRDAKGGGSGP
jgi:hypothetical protein